MAGHLNLTLFSGEWGAQAGVSFSLSNQPAYAKQKLRQANGKWSVPETAC